MKPITKKALKALKHVPEIGLVFKPTKIKKERLIDAKKQVKFLRKIYDQNNFFVREQAMLICLSSDLSPVGYHSLAIGDSESVHVDFNHLFRLLYNSGCTRFIFSHNHPMGRARPSDKDCDFNATLLRLSEILGFDFVDHLILTEDRYYSFDENYLLY